MSGIILKNDEMKLLNLLLNTPRERALRILQVYESKAAPKKVSMNTVLGNLISLGVDKFFNKLKLEINQKLLQCHFKNCNRRSRTWDFINAVQQY